jgi:acyl carrier protein
MIQENEIERAIRSFILEKFPVARRRALSDDAPLLESGIIDSLGVLDVLAFLEPTFGIKIDDEELVPQNFRSVRCLASFVGQKSRAKVLAE